MQYKVVRIWFKKCREAKYLSHLDTSRCITRALLSTNLPFWYTQGHNPHLFLTFPLPLALGISGNFECFDVKMPIDFEINDLKSEIMHMNNFLPKGLEIFDCSIPTMNSSEIYYSKYEIKLELPNIESLSTLKNFFKQDQIFAQKITKSQTKYLNLKENIKKFSIKSVEKTVLIKLILTCGNLENISPYLILNSLEKFLKHEITFEISREKILDKNLKTFK